MDGTSWSRFFAMFLLAGAVSSGSMAYRLYRDRGHPSDGAPTVWYRPALDERQLRAAGWITLPAGFRSRPDDPVGTRRLWHASHIPLLGGRLTVHAGRFTYESDVHPPYYRIEIDIPRPQSSRVLAAIEMELDRVDDDLVDASADRIVSFHESSGVVTFDLGASVFRYQLPPDIDARIAAYSKGR